MKIILFLLLIVSGAPALHAQVTYNYTGAVQVYVVPALVFELVVDMAGASGGRSIGTTVGPHDPGLGGRVETTLTVVPGDVVNIYVGGEGLDGIADATSAGGWNGGGDGEGTFVSYGGGAGGGGSDIRIGGVALTDRLVVAGAGGGSAFNYFAGGDHGGDGGGLIADDGLSGGGLLAPPGKGGTQVVGGLGGLWVGYLPGADAVLGVGGGAGTNTAGGGGGGGYYGGGGGSWGGGGGGSSYVDPGVTAGTTHTIGYQTGDGYVTITEVSVLPIEMNSFTCKPLSNNVKLDWVTFSERNNASFEIERSQNGLDKWMSILSHKGAGNSSAEINYTDFDNAPILGQSYYRLKQTDFDGNTQYFGPVSVFFDRGVELIVYPNPSSTSVTLTLPNNSLLPTEIEIFSIDGKEVTTIVSINSVSSQMLNLEISELSDGIYFIRTPFETIQFVKG